MGLEKLGIEQDLTLYCKFSDMLDDRNLVQVVEE